MSPTYMVVFPLYDNDPYIKITAAIIPDYAKVPLMNAGWRIFDDRFNEGNVMALPPRVLINNLKNMMISQEEMIKTFKDLLAAPADFSRSDTI